VLPYYVITSVIAFFNLVLLVSMTEGKKVNYYSVMMAIVMAISNIGYLAVALSTNLDEAILANKVGYVGGCFVAPLMLLCICSVCNLKLGKLLQFVVFFASFVVYVMVLFIGYSDFYYKEAFLRTVGGVSALGQEYGPGHVLFYILLYGHIASQIIILIYCMVKKASVPRTSLWTMAMIEVVNIASFIVVRAIHEDLEIMPLMFTLDGFFLIYLCNNAALYNIEDTISDALGKQEFYGYVVLDKRGRFMGCNEFAKSIFPAITECRVDQPVKEVPGLEVMAEWIGRHPGKEDLRTSYEAGEKYYECRVERILQRKKLRGYIVELQDDTQRRDYLNLLSSYNDELEQQVDEKTKQVENIQAQVLLGMANIVENRDDNTGGHIKRTSEVMKMLIATIVEEKLLPMSKEFCDDIIKAAPLHDLGKIAIDDKILRKPGRLTEEEFAVMKTHAERSAELVDSIFRDVETDHFVKVAYNIARHHHEKWNGAGYPEGLKGEDIPLEARIMAVADVYDALVSKRCYKDAMSFEEAKKVMLESMGSHFDPQMEPVLLKSLDKLEAYYRG